MTDRPVQKPDFGAAERELELGNQHLPQQAADTYRGTALTDEQRRFARELGLRPDQYARGLQEARRRGWAK